MTDRPIIFSAPMVRALLAGRKTQTRRLATSPLRRVEVGDRLWVKENFIPDPSADDDAWDDWRMSFVEWSGCGCYLRDVPDALRSSEHCYFAATARDNSGVRWRPSIHMPRWASRLTLIIEQVRVEPLQAISEDDAQAEGAGKLIWDGEGGWYESDTGTYRCGFAGIWQHLHGLESWDANPFIAALTFRVIHSNIDRIAA